MVRCKFWSSQIVLISQEVRIVSEGSHINILTFLDDSLLVKIMVILCNLVSILARRGHFDRSRPVGVHEAKAERQIFNLLFWDICMRLIHRNKEMSWSYTALSCLLRYQEEIIAFIWFIIFYKDWINNGSWFRVLHFISILHKDSLVNSFVNYNQSNLGNI